MDNTVIWGCAGMSGKIWLIVEDESDAKIVQKILSKKGLQVQVKPKPPVGGVGGISRLASQLEELIKTTRSDKEKRDCIAVLHDEDTYKQSDRTAYQQIAEICKRYAQDVKLVLAQDVLEAWLLADAGLCKWLDNKMKPQNWDNKPNAKKELETRLKKKGIIYSGRYLDKILEHIDGTGDKFSPSLRTPSLTSKTRPAPNPNPRHLTAHLLHSSASKPTAHTQK